MSALHEDTGRSPALRGGGPRPCSAPPGGETGQRLALQTRRSRDLPCRARSALRGLRSSLPALPDSGHWGNCNAGMWPRPVGRGKGARTAMRAYKTGGDCAPPLQEKLRPGWPRSDSKDAARAPALRQKVLFRAPDFFVSFVSLWSRSSLKCGAQARVPSAPRPVGNKNCCHLSKYNIIWTTVK